MKKKKLKFKKLLNEYRSLFYELEFTKEVMSDALKEFNEFYQNFLDRKKVKLDRLNQKHSTRVSQIFSSMPAVQLAAIKEERKKEFDSKKIFRQIAKSFHPDTLAADDPRQQEYQSIFQRANNAIDEAEWGTLFDIVDKHDLNLEDYDTAIECLHLDITRTQKKIDEKKTTYAWLFYECEDCVAKEILMKQYLNHIYIDYKDPT
jgi:hypothetical protein